MPTILMGSLWFMRAVNVWFYAAFLSLVAYVLSGWEALVPPLHFWADTMTWWIVIPYAICAGFVAMTHNYLNLDREALWGVSDSLWLSVLLGVFVAIRGNGNEVEGLNVLLLLGGGWVMFAAAFVAFFTVRPAMEKRFNEDYKEPLIEDLMQRKSAENFDQAKLKEMGFNDLEDLNAQLAVLEKDSTT